MLTVKLRKLGQVNVGVGLRSLEKGNGAGFPLVTINSSGDGNAGRDTRSSAPMSAPVYSTAVDHKDTIKKLYPLVITNSDLTKREQHTD